MEALGDEQTHWDVISGISVGAIDATGYGIFPPGAEVEAADFMVHFWKGMNHSTVFKKWDDGWWNAVFKHRGLMNNTAFVDYIQSQVPENAQLHRKMTVGSADLNTGNLV